MDDLSRRGGGTVFFPVGVYQVIGVLKARDAVSLYLAPGARIRSLPDPAHYGNDKFTHPMFDVTAVSNFKIHGRGTLDASGMKIMKRSNTSRRRRIIFGDLKASKRSTRISIKGIVLRDATAWTCSIIYADHCLVEGVKVLNHWDQNDVKIQNDGINLIACRNSVVNGNFVMTGDDAMCAKAQRVGAETSHLTFSNNVLFTMGAGNKVGMNCRGPLHDVVFANNTVIACRRGVVIEAKTKENPTPIRSITFRNITVEGYQGYKGFEQKLLEFKADTAPVRGVRVSNVRSLIRSPDNQSIWGKSGVFDVRVEGLRIGSRLILNRRAGDISIAKGSDSIRFGPGSDKPSRP
jgi:polygalacturonase